MKRSSILSANSLNRTLQAVNEAWKRSQFQPAIEQLERARRLNPSNLDILLNLGRFHGLRYNYAAAETCFEQAIRIAPRKSELLALVGQQCRKFSQLEMAGRYLERAIAQPDVSANTLTKLAEVHERLRHLAEAAS